jgi:hypothetical protein
MGAQGSYHTLEDGTRLPRVTSILDAISKARLVSWAARVEREHVVRVASEMGQVDTLSLGANLGQYAHERELEEANAIGSAVHTRIEWRLKRELGREVGPKPFLNGPGLIAYTAWTRWREAVELKPIHIEQRVWSRTHGYAGTMDLFCEMTLPGVGRVFSLPDWKTSKRIYGEAGIQNAAYTEALVEMGHAKHPISGVIVRLPKVDPPHGAPPFEAETRIFGPETHTRRLELFLHAFEIWKWQQEEEARFKPVELPAPARPGPVGDEFSFG